MWQNTRILPRGKYSNQQSLRFRSRPVSLTIRLERNTRCLHRNLFECKHPHAYFHLESTNSAERRIEKGEEPLVRMRACGTRFNFQSLKKRAEADDVIKEMLVFFLFSFGAARYRLEFPRRHSLWNSYILSSNNLRARVRFSDAAERAFNKT